jgi:acyl-CoA reductase-like NAD-dependent aldehyde dehydrogenase
VCALITAWNGPIALPAWKIATALACGNTVILKPAEDTPLTSIRLVHLLEQADIPKGVVNLVLGDGQNVGSPMGTHPDIDKISFTGSTAVGKHLIQAAGGICNDCHWSSVENRLHWSWRTPTCSWRLPILRTECSGLPARCAL